MLEIAKQKVPGVEFRKMDMRRLDIPDGSYDGLFVTYSLIHVSTIELRTTLKGFLRILKGGGHMLLISQKGDADQVVDEPFWEGRKMFFNFFTKERLREALELCDFEVVYQEEKPSQDSNSMSDTVIYTIVR